MVAKFVGLKTPGYLQSCIDAQIKGALRTAAIGKVNFEGSSMEELLAEQVEKTTVETTTIANALHGDLAMSGLENATAESELAKVRDQLIEAVRRVEVAKVLMGAEKKVIAKLKESLADLRKNVEVQKKVIAQDYIKEKSEELVAMGAKLMEG